MEQTFTVIALYGRVEGYSFGTYDLKRFRYSEKENKMKAFVQTCKEQKTCVRIIIVDNTTGECEQSTPENWI